MILIFDLGFRQGRLIERAPEDGFQSFIDAALFDERPELAKDRRLILGIQGEIRMVPIAEDAQPLKFVALDRDVLFRIFAA